MQLLAQVASSFSICFGYFGSNFCGMRATIAPLCGHTCAAVWSLFSGFCRCLCTISEIGIIAATAAHQPDAVEFPMTRLLCWDRDCRIFTLFQLPAFKSQTLHSRYSLLARCTLSVAFFEILLTSLGSTNMICGILRHNPALA